MNLKAWITAFRLRTLPLALAGIIMGSLLAFKQNSFSWLIFFLSVLTATFLQILSNLANDYGDSENGADSSQFGRKGPERMVQTGAISMQNMKFGMYIFGILAFVTGISLLYFSFKNVDFQFIVFLFLGLSAIVAAVKYTAGKNPYGYMGLGDLSVFIFFGLVAVGGSYYLQVGNLKEYNYLPSITIGLFATAVLNLNNIRDIESDKLAGKNSIPVRIGRKNANLYHFLLIEIGFLASVVYMFFNQKGITSWLFLIVIPFLILNIKAVYTKQEASELDPYLKQMALTTLLFVITFGLSLFL